MALVVARKTVVRELIPRRARCNEGVKLRPDSGVRVERAEADRHLVALGPLRAEEAGAADQTEGLYASVVRPEDADQLLPGKQTEPVAGDPSLSSAEGARVLSAPRAVAVIGPAKRCRHLEADAATEAGALERVLRARLSGHGERRYQEPRYRLYAGLVSADLERLGRRLVGTWTTDATHPALPGTTFGGTADVRWLEGERFLIWRSHSDHPDFPDSISIIGDTDGLQWHYFDSRGVHRIYEFRVTDDGWEMARDAPEFSQRMTVTFEDDDDTMAGLAKLSVDDDTWQDDLQIAYRRSR
jgi:hypothetical protein